MYERKFPEQDEVVMVFVKNITDMGVHVGLLEYDNMEGLLLLTELSRRRMRSIGKVIKVGQNVPVMVQRVDQRKGSIDLSKRRVDEEDYAACVERFDKSKLVHSIFSHVAEKTSVNLIELYEQFGWPCYKKYGHAFDAFKVLVRTPVKFFNLFVRETVETSVVNGEETQQTKVQRFVPVLEDKAVRDALLKDIQRRMTPQPVKIRADVELTCFQYDGILHIREAMKAGASAGTSNSPVKVQNVAAPLYVLTTQTVDEEEGMASVLEGIKRMRLSIEQNKGRIVVKEDPRIVNDRDDRLLEGKMELASLDSSEIPGDEDDDASDGGSIKEFEVFNEIDNKEVNIPVVP